MLPRPRVKAGDRVYWRRRVVKVQRLIYVQIGCPKVDGWWARLDPGAEWPVRCSNLRAIS